MKDLKETRAKELSAELLEKVKKVEIEEIGREYGTDDVLLTFELLDGQFGIVYQNGDMNGDGGAEFLNPGADEGWRELTSFIFDNFSEVRNDHPHEKLYAKDTASCICRQLADDYNVESFFSEEVEMFDYAEEHILKMGREELGKIKEEDLYSDIENLYFKIKDQAEEDNIRLKDEHRVVNFVAWFRTKFVAGY